MKVFWVHVLGSRDSLILYLFESFLSLWVFIFAMLKEYDSANHSYKKNFKSKAFKQLYSAICSSYKTLNDVAKSKIPANVNGSFTVLSVKRLHNMELRHESGARTRMLSAVCIPRYKAMKDLLGQLRPTYESRQSGVQSVKPNAFYFHHCLSFNHHTSPLCIFWEGGSMI